MKTYYQIVTESYIDSEKYSTLMDAKSAIASYFTKEEQLKYFNDNHTPMIEKNVLDKSCGEYQAKSYTPFVCTDAGVRFFSTSKDFEKAFRSIKDYKLGL